MSGIGGIWQDPLYRLVVATFVAQIVALSAVAMAIVIVRFRRQELEAVMTRVRADVSPNLFAYLADEIRVDELVRRTSGYSVRQLALVIEAYVSSLTGRNLGDIGLFYERSGMLKAALRLCRSLFWWQRLEGARILGSAGGRLGVDRLLRMLEDRSHVVRLAAARALGRSGDPAHIEPLLRAMRRGRMSRVQIAEVLVTLGSDTRLRLRELVMQLPHGAATAQLRATTLEVLALVGDSGATPFIQFAIDSPDVEVRVAAYKATAILRVALSEDEMRKGLEDSAWQVRSAACLAAGAAKARTLANDLGRMVADRSWWVRYNAATALDELGGDGLRVLEHLAETHPDRFARGMAKRVLSEDPAYGELSRFRERNGDAVEGGA